MVGVMSGMGGDRVDRVDRSDDESKGDMRTKPEPREDFIGRWPHDEIWEFALRWAAVAAGFSVASAMLEQLLAERNAEEGYPGIAADFETCKAHLRRAAEIGAGTVNPDTVAEWKRAASLPNEKAEGLR